jgi:hypothetical protein
VEKISEATDPERMRAVRSSYGLFGRIFEVTFCIQKQTTLSYSHVSFRLTSLPIRDELFGGADSMFDFEFDRSHYFDFTFWAIPLSCWEARSSGLEPATFCFSSDGRPNFPLPPTPSGPPPSGIR